MKKKINLKIVADHITNWLTYLDNLGWDAWMNYSEEEIIAMKENGLSKVQFANAIKQYLNTDKIINAAINETYAAFDNIYKEAIRYRKLDEEYMKSKMEKAILADSLTKAQKAKLKKYCGVKL